ncbi:MMOB1660 family gliding motility ATPase complex subunit [Mesomycoplasma moatsii]|uniref:MMOB1660 family gliding motility ATPase complex subunit n=1 Tax=Mesomycoplasma moatsii TaxID=171287 RepID=UPI0003B66AEF
MKEKELSIISIKDDIIVVEGQHSFQFLEEIKFGKEVNGIVIRANFYRAYVALVGKSTHEEIKVGGKAFATGKVFTVSIFNNFFGAIIDVNSNILVEGNRVDLIKVLAQKFVLSEAKPLYTRKEVNQPLQTGTSAIDGLLPIGRGQKELIVGDAVTGKTSIAITALLSQESSNVLNIYVAIGKKREELIEIKNVLESRGVLSKTIIIATAPDDSAASKFLAPYVGASIAEYLQEQGEDVLVIFDDLTNHADAYRELSLSTGSAPGREAFPGDIFYVHSRLLERCGRYQPEVGGGSITMIPIAQTLDGDISGYIPTNIISITDGQIYTSTDIFNEGRRPAIEISISVSRLGSQVQTKSMRKATSGLKNLVSEYENFKKFASFNSNISDKDRETIAKGKAFEIIINQDEYEVISLEVTAIMFMLLKNGFLSLFFNEGIEKAVELFTTLKDVIKVFLTKDVLGRKLIQIVNEKDVDDEAVSLYQKHIILPLIKYHLLSENKWLRNNPEFIKVFKDIRNDGRVLLAYERRGLEKGIAYEI